MSNPKVSKVQIDQLIHQRFPYISKSLAQKVSQLTHEKHLYRIGNNKKPVLLINRIKQVAQDQSTPVDVRRFLSDEFLPQSIQTRSRGPQKRWNDYVADIREIYKNRNYLVYSSTDKRKRFQVDIQRSGISIHGPTTENQGDHHLQIKQGGKILLDGKEPMTSGERNAAMQLMGELFGQLKINPEWAKRKEELIKMFVAGKLYQQGKTKQQPYLTMPVHDFAKLRTTLKSMKSMQYPQQQQNRLISSITHKDRELQSYREVRDALIPLLTTYRDVPFFKSIKKLMLKIPMTPWTQFWRKFGELIYNSREDYDTLHTSQDMRATFNQMEMEERKRLLLPPSDGRMLVWTFDRENKTLVVIIRGLGFIFNTEDHEYDTFEDGSLLRKTSEMVLDISQSGVIVLVTDSSGDFVTELFFTPSQLARVPEINQSLQNILTTAIQVHSGKDNSQTLLVGDAYYRLPISIDEGDYVCFLPTKTYLS